MLTWLTGSLHKAVPAAGFRSAGTAPPQGGRL